MDDILGNPVSGTAAPSLIDMQYEQDPCALQPVDSALILDSESQDERHVGPREASSDDEGATSAEKCLVNFEEEKLDEDASLKAADLARVEADDLKAAEEARLQAEEAEQHKAEEEVKMNAVKAQEAEEEEARLKVAEEAKLKAEEIERLKAAEEARMKADEEAQMKAAEEARLQAEEAAEEARLRALKAQEEEEMRLKAAEEARSKAEEIARLKAEEEARLSAEEELRVKAAEEARLKAEEDEQMRVAEEAKLRAMRAEEEARLRAAEEERLKLEEQLRLKAEEESRIKVEEDARLKAAEAAALKVEADAQLKAAEEARLKALQAEEEKRVKTAEEARMQAEERERIEAAEAARLKAEEDARSKEVDEARLKAHDDERLKVVDDEKMQALQAEEVARQRTADEARMKTEQDSQFKATELERSKTEELSNQTQIQANDERVEDHKGVKDRTIGKEVAEWMGKVEEQRNALNDLAKSRTQIRSTVESLQQQIASLQAENARLKSGGIAAALESRRQILEKQLNDVESSHSSLRLRLAEGEEDLAAAGSRVEETRQRGLGATSELLVMENTKSQVQQRLNIAKEVQAAAEKRLSGMVSVGALQKHEAECNRYREEIKSNEREARQLRVSLAETLSSSTDLPNTMQELTLLKESTAKASKRVESLEALNEQIRGRIAQLVQQNSQLQKGAFDLQNESELMREVIVQQNESLLRKVEDLTEERQTADADRKQLLETTADLLVEVDSAESRISKRKQLESDSASMESEMSTLISKIDRLRNSNRAYAQQVFDGDGPFAGALQPPFNCDVDRSLYDEVSRLLQGKALHSISNGDIKSEASSLSLRVQQTLAEREEAFWVERQKLSDRVSALERARGGRTGSLLREYNSAVRGSSTSANGASSLGSGNGSSLTTMSDLASAASYRATDAALSAADKVTDGFQKLRSAMLK